MTNSPAPTLAQRVRWPLMIVGLLAAHTALMMFALAMSLAFPASLDDAKAVATPAAAASPPGIER